MGNNGIEPCCADLPDNRYYDPKNKNETVMPQKQSNNFEEVRPPELNGIVQQIKNKLSPFPLKKKNTTKKQEIMTKKVNSSGLIYSGTWAGGFPEGIGQFFYPDGSYYIGYISNGLPSVDGRFISSEGWYYEGALLNEQAQGHGVFLKIANQKIQYKYQGNWEGDLPNGFGQQVWPQKGVFYEGYFLNGKKHGEGEYKIQNILTYVGNFNQNEICSKGKIVYKNKQSYEGTFKDGKKHGYGVYRWPDGSFYQGKYQYDIKHGEGKYVLPNGKSFQGQWFHGKLQDNNKL